MKIFLKISFALILTFISFVSVNAQKIQATIAKTGVANQVGVYARSSTAYNNQIGNITFAFSIADLSATTGNPTDAQIAKVLAPNNVSFYTTGISNPYIYGGRAIYVYNVVPTSGTDVATSWPANNDNLIATLTFPDETGFPTMRLEDLIFQDGTPTSGIYWYVELTGGVGDQTDFTTPYYGAGATNNGGTALQFVPLQDPFTTPVKFTNFSAIKKDNTALLTWQITNEDANVVSYEVERSVNGIAFTKFTSVLPKNNGSTNNTYNLIDNNLNSVQTSGVVYYRIKQIDKDGKYTYTDIKSVRITAKGVVINVYPNPVRNSANLSLDLVDDAAVVVNVTDAAGKEIKHLNFNASKGLNVKNIDMSTLASGSYLIKVQAGTDIKTLPVVKTN